MAELVHCARYVERDGLLVDIGFDLLVSVESDMSGAQRIAWAEEQEARVKHARVLQRK